MIQRGKRYIAHRASLVLTLLFNWFGTWVPSHRLRQAWLRAAGARIGDDSSIFMGTQVLAPSQLTIGDRCVIGARSYLDARGVLSIAHDTNLANDVQIITGSHDLDSEHFAASFKPVTIGHHCWVTTRALVLAGVTVGDYGVVAAQSVVSRDVPGGEVWGGAPARFLRMRGTRGDYRLGYRPRFF